MVNKKIFNVFFREKPSMMLINLKNFIKNAEGLMKK